MANEQQDPAALQAECVAMQEQFDGLVARIETVPGIDTKQLLIAKLDGETVFRRLARGIGRAIDAQ